MSGAVSNVGAKIIGLTGQSGAGKTLVSEVFVEHGFGIINCDLVAREVTEPMSACNSELLTHFPTCVDERTMVLDRRALGAIVFSDRAKLELLNSIIFRYIRDAIDRKIASMSSEYEYILLDAPTLFEAGVDKQCEAVVSVTASEQTRLGRVMERDGLDEKSAKERFSSQHSAEFFERNSDFVIRNDGSIEDVIRQIKDVIKKIKEG